MARNVLRQVAAQDRHCLLTRLKSSAMSNINDNHRENPKSRGNTLNKKNGKQWKTILNKDIARRPGNGTNEMNSTKFDRLHPWTLGWKPMTGTPIMIPRHNKNIAPFVVGIYFLPIMVPSNRTVQRANRRKLFHHFPSLNSGRRSRHRHLEGVQMQTELWLRSRGL